MAVIVSSPKPLSVSPLKASAPLGGALAFMGMEGSLPLFHGAQGCTAFALVSMVRHFREAIPLQTTAMNEITTILGGMDNIEEALLAITRRAKPSIIGLLSTALTETRGEDVESDLRAILARNLELSGVAVVYASAPDYAGSLETGWSRAVEAMLRELPKPAETRTRLKRINILPGVHLTPGDVEALRDIVADFGLDAVILPDLSAALDGHVPGHYVPTTLGGTTVAEARSMGRSLATIAVGEHMRPAAELLAERTGVPAVVFDRLSGLEPVDRLMVTLSSLAERPVPPRYRRQRSQLVDAMLDCQFVFSGRRLAMAGEPDLLVTLGNVAAEMGAEVTAAVSATASPHLDQFPAGRVVVGDLDDLEAEIEATGGCDLVIANSNARQLAERLGVPLCRAGFPINDRLGAPHWTTLGYRGTRDLIFTLGSQLMEAASHQFSDSGGGHSHDHPPFTAC